MRALLPVETQDTVEFSASPAIASLVITHQHRPSQELQSYTRALSKFWQILMKVLYSRKEIRVHHSRRWMIECDASLDDSQFSLLSCCFNAFCGALDSLRRLAGFPFSRDSPDRKQFFQEVALLTVACYVLRDFSISAPKLVLPRLEIWDGEEENELRIDVFM